MIIVPIMAYRVNQQNINSKLGKIELQNNVISVSTNFNEYAELNHSTENKISLPLKEIQKNKKYIFLINIANGYIITNFKDEFNTYYYENMLWGNNPNLYEVKLWYTEADELFIYANFAIESETIDFQIYNREEENPELKNMYQVIKHRSADPAAADLYNKDTIFLLRRMELNSKFRPSSSLAYMDVQVDFILTFINFFLEANKEISDAFFEKHPEYKDIFSQMLSTSILDYKTQEEIANTMRRKEIARQLQKNYYEEVVLSAENI